MWHHKNDKILRRLLSAVNGATLIGSSRHAAAIVWRDRVISVGVNSLKSHPAMVKHQPNKQRIYLHAEVDAIIKATNRHGVDFLSECSLYVLRQTKGGRVANSEPCPGCSNMIQAMGIKHVYHS
jgi:deoxycytidylate deaminase